MSVLVGCPAAVDMPNDCANYCAYALLCVCLSASMVGLWRANVDRDGMLCRARVCVMLVVTTLCSFDDNSNHSLSGKEVQIGGFDLVWKSGPVPRTQYVEPVTADTWLATKRHTLNIWLFVHCKQHTVNDNAFWTKCWYDCFIHSTLS